MEDQNVILFMDKIKKLIELGNKPKAVSEIEALDVLLQKAITRKKGKHFIPLSVPTPTEEDKSNLIIMRDFEIANKVNEIINFLNNRHPIF